MEIQIKNIDGSVILSVIADDNAIYHEELMTSEYIKLSWQSDSGNVLPVGTYIEYEGEKYRLLEPYTPQQTDEATYSYTPQFQSRIMNWGKQIVPVYTYEDDGTTVKTREMDWEFTGSPADAMYIIKQAIKNETGEEWTVQLAENLPATITISAQSTTILAMLNNIATECDTEFWTDKKTNTLYLSKCVFGEPITLTVGDNVKVSSITNSNEGYYTRFYAFGSTRNIQQTSVEGEANVNKRLTLDPAKYPYGYKDIREGLKQGEIFPKTLYFDDIYPSSKLTISDVRPRLRYRLDNNGQRIQVGGTDENPIYEQYAIWYFQIAGFTFDPTSVIEGLNLSVSFESGQLNGRDFELTYHEKSETARDANDVTLFEIKAGDYEIIIDETSGQIIPGTSYIIPQDGDMIILYNIKMPAEYTSSAQLELEAALDEAIAKQLEDNNTYQTSSNPVSFYEDETDLRMGRSVNFVYLGKTLQSRIMMVEKRLDEPCNQSFSIGNKVIKGNTQQLKEEVANVNQNIDIIKAFNDLSTSLSQAYANAQREMIEGFAAIKNLWQLKQDDEGNYYAYTEYDVLGKKGITAYSAGTAKVPSIFDGLPLDNVTIWKNPETGLIEVIGGTGGGSDFDATKMWAALSAATDEQINKSHLTTALNGYATESWVQGKGYALQTSLDAVSAKLNNFLEGSDTDTIINKWKELEAFLSGMAETDNLAEILSNKADTSYVNTEFSKYVTLDTEQSINGQKTFVKTIYQGSSLANRRAISFVDKSNNAIFADVKGRTIFRGNLLSFQLVNGTDIAKINDNGLFVGNVIESNNSVKSLDLYINGVHVYKENDVLFIDGDLAVTGGVTAYAQGSRTLSTILDGLIIDENTLSKEGGKLSVIGGVGSDFDSAKMWELLLSSTNEQINKSHITTALNGYATESWVTGKNYLTSVNISTISDLHSSWDAVLKTQKPNYLTAVSLSTISDLNSSWDTLLKNSPTIYVTRHPTISEVTNKQNLIIKLNGGATEGTNMFTYNATSAKTVNITYSSVGAAASSHNHSWANITSGKPTTLSGYGITDAVTLNTTQYITGEKIFGSTIYQGSSATVRRAISFVDGSWNCILSDTKGATILRGSIIRFQQVNGTDSATIQDNEFYVKTTTRFQYSTTMESDTLVRTNKYITTNPNDKKDNIPWYSYGFTTNSAIKPGYITALISSYYGVHIRSGNYIYLEASNIGIGISNPSYKLDVNGTMRVMNNAKFNANVGIGVDNPSQKLQVYGNILASGGVTALSSDQRAKTIVEQLSISLKQISAAPTIRFRWNGWKIKDDGKTHVGGIAQYIQALLPETVVEAGGMLNLDYATTGYIFAVLTARHLMVFETKTERKLRKLEKEILYLKTKLKQLGYEEIDFVAD